MWPSWLCLTELSLGPRTLPTVFPQYISIDADLGVPPWAAGGQSASKLHSDGQFVTGTARELKPGEVWSQKQAEPCLPVLKSCNKSSCTGWREGEEDDFCCLCLKRANDTSQAKVSCTQNKTKGVAFGSSGWCDWGKKGRWSWSWQL